MSGRGRTFPRPLLNFRCSFSIEAPNVGEEHLDDLVYVVERNITDPGKVAGKGSTNHPQFPQTVFIELSQDRINAYDLIKASEQFTRRIGQDSRLEQGTNHLFTLIANAEVDSLLPRPFADVQGIDEAIDFEITIDGDVKMQAENVIATVAGRETFIYKYLVNVVETSDGNEKTVIQASTGNSFMNVGSIAKLDSALTQDGIPAETFNITCTVSEVVRG